MFKRLFNRMKRKPAGESPVAFGGRVELSLEDQAAMDQYANRLHRTLSGDGDPEFAPLRDPYDDTDTVETAEEIRIDLNKVLDKLSLLMERHDLDPSVPVSLTDVTSAATWRALLYGGAGPIVVEHVLRTTRELIDSRYATFVPGPLDFRSMDVTDLFENGHELDVSESARAIMTDGLNGSELDVVLAPVREADTSEAMDILVSLMILFMGLVAVLHAASGTPDAQQP
ncbi:MAG: hypothetical protein U5N21_14535 [Rhodococcus sp. (in: high G+C Gram-positive bacteria)]|nr:hypothetical protein [Rhodococcus sp. (in: high G+C Gram-positive bacteria)]